jgi:hypothetical protein
MNSPNVILKASVKVEAFLYTAFGSTNQKATIKVIQSAELSRNANGDTLLK